MWAKHWKGIGLRKDLPVEPEGTVARWGPTAAELLIGCAVVWGSLTFLTEFFILQWFEVRAQEEDDSTAALIPK